MKTALFIDGESQQIVLTPETEAEKRILAMMHEGTPAISLHRGEFYACQGGWNRQRDALSGDSTILVLRPGVPF